MKKKSSLSKVGCLSHDTQEQKYMKVQLKDFLMNTVKVTRRNGDIVSLDVSPGNRKTTNRNAGYHRNEIFQNIIKITEKKQTDTLLKGLSRKHKNTIRVTERIQEVALLVAVFPGNIGKF